MRAFVFPGQASQKVGMGDWLIEKYPVAREVYEQADDELGYSITELILQGPMEKLTETEITQPAVLTTSVAYARVMMEELGLKPDVVAGHSLGEYSALVAAGAVDFGEAVRAVRDRGRYMQEAVPLGEGTMAAIFRLNADQVDQICASVREDTGGVVESAGYNAADLNVISGDRASVEAAMERCREQRGNATEIAVSAPFHCALMRPAADRLAERLKDVSVGDLGMPYIPNVNAELERDRERVVGHLVDQVCAPVRWAHTVRTMLDMGVDEFYEVGPGNVLCGFIRRCDRTLKPMPVGDPRGRKLFE